MSRDRDDDRGRRSRDDDDDRGSRRGRDGRDEGRRSRDDDDRGGRRGGSRFEYQSRDRAEVQRRSEARGGGDFDRFLKEVVKIWTPNDGDNCFRPLPPTWTGAKHYGLDIFVHYGVGPDKATYLCPNKMLKKPCPICEEYAEVMRTASTKEDEEYAKKLKPKDRVLIYLVDRDAEKEGVQAWAMPWGLDKDYCNLSQDKRSREVYEVDHPEHGYDLMFRRTGQGIKTKYEAPSLARRESELGKDEWLEFAQEHPLPDMLVYYDYDHIKAAFTGSSGEHRSSRDDDDRDDSRSRSRRDERDSDSSSDSRRIRDDDRERDSGRRSSRSSDAAEDDRGRRSSSRDEPELTWESIHDMTSRELEDLIDSEKLEINPKEAKDDADLADWICEEMKISKPERGRGRDREERSDSKDSDERVNRLQQMRRQRGD